MTKGSRSFEKFSKMSNEAKETLYWFIFNKKPEDNNILTNADVMSKTLSVAAKGNIKDVNNNKKQRCVFDSNDNITINGDVELDGFPYEELPAIGVVEIKGSLVIKNSSFISFKNFPAKVETFYSKNGGKFKNLEKFPKITNKTTGINAITFWGGVLESLEGLKDIS